jgi:haloacetate dehalogenase
MSEQGVRARIDVGDVEINCVYEGHGPPLLLLHGYPQNLSEWAALTPLLSDELTVVRSDLRGYGDSSKPHASEDGANYSFRAMAADQVALMDALGFDSFHVGGHDRGGRVAHRLALDHPDRVRSLAVMDVVPTYAMYHDTNAALAARYWQWYFLPLPEPFPERLIGADPDYYFENCLVANGGTGLDAYDSAMLEDYRRCWRDPAMIHASSGRDHRPGARRSRPRHDGALPDARALGREWPSASALRHRRGVVEAMFGGPLRFGAGRALLP